MPESYDDKKKSSIKEIASVGKNNGSSVADLTERVTELQNINEEIRAARKAALNLMEDAILAKEALHESETRLAQDLKDAKLLQHISSRLIETDNIQVLYDEIIDAAMSIMHSDSGSLQIFVPEKKELLLLAWKGFHLQSAPFWKWTDAHNNTPYGIALRTQKRIIVPDVEKVEPVENPEDLHHFRLSDIRSMQSTPLVTRSGKVVGMISTHWKEVHTPVEGELALLDILARQAADLLERRNAEEALRNSEERLRVTMESAVDFAIITMNTERIIEQWNTGAEHIFGYTAEEAKGKTADIIFTEEDKAKMQPEQEMQTAKEKGYAEDERWHQRRDGSKFYASGVMRAICNPELSGYVKIARDITQQKILEQQKDDFIAIASHELRTPLTGIKAYIEILHEMQQEGGTIEADLFKKLDDQVDRLIELVRSLLDTSKLAQGQLALSPENFNLNELVAERVQEMKLTTGIHKIKLASKGDAFVTADKKRIDEVLTNLISNAIKYSPKGGEIIIKLAKTTEGIQVSVRDNGMGVPEELKNKIFDRFYRVRNAQVNTFPGLGLGLYIASIIIHQHGGRIWLDSTLNKGSTFYFLLPCS